MDKDELIRRALRVISTGITPSHCPCKYRFITWKKRYWRCRITGKELKVRGNVADCTVYDFIKFMMEAI